ncbi:hypothetical protein GCM10022630_35220 [Thermobifida alba]
MEHDLGGGPGQLGVVFAEAFTGFFGFRPGHRDRVTGLAPVEGEKRERASYDKGPDEENRPDVLSTIATQTIKAARFHAVITIPLGM